MTRSTAKPEAIRRACRSAEVSAPDKIKYRTFLRIKFRGGMGGKPLHIAAMGFGKFETIFLRR